MACHWIVPQFVHANNKENIKVAHYWCFVKGIHWWLEQKATDAEAFQLYDREHSMQQHVTTIPIVEIMAQEC